MAAPEDIVSTNELAALLDLTPQRINQLTASGVVKKIGRAQYELGASIQGYVRFVRETSAEGGRTADQRARLLKAQADAAERENEIADGDLVHIGDVEQFIQARLVALSQLLDALGSRVAGAFPDGQAQRVKAMIDDDISRARGSLVDEWEKVATSEMVRGLPEAGSANA